LESVLNLVYEFPIQFFLFLAVLIIIVGYFLVRFYLLDEERAVESELPNWNQDSPKDYKAQKRTENGVVSTKPTVSTKRRGYKGAAFQKALDKYLSDRFKVAGNVEPSNCVSSTLINFMIPHLLQNHIEEFEDGCFFFDIKEQVFEKIRSEGLIPFFDLVEHI